MIAVVYLQSRPLKMVHRNLLVETLNIRRLDGKRIAVYTIQFVTANKRAVASERRFTLASEYAAEIQGFDVATDLDPETSPLRLSRTDETQITEWLSDRDSKHQLGGRSSSMYDLKLFATSVMGKIETYPGLSGLRTFLQKIQSDAYTNPVDVLCDDESELIRRFLNKDPRIYLGDSTLNRDHSKVNQIDFGHVGCPIPKERVIYLDPIVVPIGMTRN